MFLHLTEKKYMPFTPFVYRTYLLKKRNILSCNYFPAKNGNTTMPRVSFPRDFICEMNITGNNNNNIRYAYKWIYMDPLTKETTGELSSSGKAKWPEWQMRNCKILATKEWMHLHNTGVIDNARPGNHGLVLKLEAYQGSKRVPSHDKIEYYFWLSGTTNEEGKKGKRYSYAFLFDGYNNELLPEFYKEALDEWFKPSAEHNTSHHRQEEKIDYVQACTLCNYCDYQKDEIPACDDLPNSKIGTAGNLKSQSFTELPKGKNKKKLRRRIRRKENASAVINIPGFH